MQDRRQSTAPVDDWAPGEVDELIADLGAAISLLEETDIPEEDPTVLERLFSLFA